MPESTSARPCRTGSSRVTRLVAGHSTCSCRLTSWRYGENHRPARCKRMLLIGALPLAVARRSGHVEQGRPQDSGVSSRDGNVNVAELKRTEDYTVVEPMMLKAIS